MNCAICLGGHKAKVREPVGPTVNADGNKASTIRTTRTRNKKKPLSKQK